MTLSPEDIKAIASAVQQEHLCRFHNVAREDMDFLKDLIGIYKETRSEVIKWLVRGVVYGVIVIMSITLYIKLGAKS